MITGLTIYIAASYCTEIVIHYLGCKILNKRVPWIRIIIASLIINLTISPVLYLFMTGYLKTFLPNNLLYYLLDMSVVIINLVSMYIIFERNVFKIIISGTFAYFIFYQTYLISFLFVPMQFAYNSITNQFISCSVLILFTLLIGKVITRLNVISFVNRCMANRKHRIYGSITGFLLAGSSNYFVVLSRIIKDYNTLVAVIGLGLLFLFAVFYQFATRNIIHEENEKSQKNIITQQNAYIQSLEEIQKDVRIYRHDFRNIMTGMYLDVKEGKTEAIENYMQGMLNDFDQRIGAKIQIANQMMNLEIIELKSLLMTKLTLMQTLHIPYHFEVMYPVKKCGINIQDLLRCIGILIDNAIEEVKNTAGNIEIIITAQSDYVDFFISNSIKEQPDLLKIWKKGYSTKGVNRGLGLYSYQQIANQYANVSCLTDCRDERFYQELRIGV
ncbi:sensor histidine kinase [Robinsoniella sp. KNHs210]|uniref:sensor histidine kinase n=1 Tax=Robinsoniella sp. KNHs210 TaxID=1469950 RepID=UPI000AFEA1A1|nr:GHKL domain-containing protein [Robinsoniella sp. KNHs210]